MATGENFNIQMQDPNAYTGFNGTSQQTSEVIPISASEPIDFDPLMCFWTMVFKALQVVFYFVLKFLVGADLLTFVVIVLMVSFDFWVTKNLTGRKLAGLRWWTEYNQYQQEEWIFESCDPARIINPYNENFFWGSQASILAYWMILTLVNLVTLNFFWVLLAVFAGLLSGINLVCFFKCRGAHQSKVQYIAQKIGIPGL